MDQSSIPRIFIGFDKAETVASYVLAHSIQRQASGPVNITFLNRRILPFFTRKRGELDSTDFSISRFLVPYLCGYEGWALFIDCDMIALADVYEIWAQRNDDYAVRVVKHPAYFPKEEIKFLGNQQTAYNKKNWSSVMFFNNRRCKDLTLKLVNSAPGLHLHRFEWLAGDHLIGSLPKEWNVLIGVQDIPEFPKLLHYTSGGPYFPEYRNCQCSDLWFEELRDMLHVETGDLQYLV